jgi:hypothetical protein
MPLLRPFVTGSDESEWEQVAYKPAMVLQEDNSFILGNFCCDCVLCIV